MSNARTIPWETIADWYAKNEQAIRDVMKFEGLRSAVNEVLRLAPDQPELSALREELAKVIEDRARFPDRPDFIGNMISAHIGNLKAGKASSDKYASDYIMKNGVLEQRLAAAEQRNAELEKDAARYLWLRDKSESVHQFYLSTPIWFTGVKFNQESVDSAIDAAITAALKPTESGASE